MSRQQRGSGLAAVLTLVLAWSLASSRAYPGDKESLQPVQGLTVFDGNGKRVGPVFGFSGSLAAVSFRVNGELVIIGVNRDGFSGGVGFTPGAPTLFFESNSCTGAAFIQSGPGPTLLAPFHFLSGTILYGLDPPSKAIIVGSLLNPNGNCQPQSPFEATVTPLRFLIDLGTQFQPPFSLR